MGGRVLPKHVFEKFCVMLMGYVMPMFLKETRRVIGESYQNIVDVLRMNLVVGVCFSLKAFFKESAYRYVWVSLCRLMLAVQSRV